MLFFTIYYKEIFLTLILLFLILYIIGILTKNNELYDTAKYIFCGVTMVYFLFGLYVKMSTPIIDIEGGDIIELEVNNPYKSEEVKICQFNRRINIAASTNSNVDLNKIGSYQVKYFFNYMGETVEKIKTINIVDKTKPKIILKGEKEVNMYLNQEYIEEGYYAYDNYDKNLTNKVEITSNLENKVGIYELKYSVSDTSGNRYSVNRIVNVLENDNGLIYLTFDDGPSFITEKVLDILKEENIKATFFVIGFGPELNDTARRIVDEGHTIALHSYTHNFGLIYSSESAFFDDISRIKTLVKKVTGIDSKIIRFAGGSSNTRSSFNPGIMSRLTREVLDRNYRYFDWNVSSRDAEGAKNSNEVYNSVINGLSKKRSNVVIMHDQRYSNRTLNALRDIIITAKNRGYRFEKITNYTPIVKHHVSN